MSNEREAAVSLVLACLHGDVRVDEATVGPMLRAADPEAVVDLAGRHGVAGWLYESLEPFELPPRLRVSLAERHAAIQGAHAQALADLGAIHGAIEHMGVRWAVLEGPVAAHQLYPSTGARDYRDLDLLVDPKAFGDVLDVVTKHGARLVETDWRALGRTMPGHLSLVLPGGTDLDLHWDLNGKRSTRINTGALLERSDRTEIGPLSVPTLDPADSLVYLAVHGFLSGIHRWRRYKDIERSLVLRPPGWTELVDRARSARTDRFVGLMLRQTVLLLGAPVPTSLPRILLGRPLSVAAAALDRVAPEDRTFSRRAIRAVAVRAFELALAGEAGELFRRRRAGPKSPAEREGSAADRAAFLHAVGRFGSGAEP